MKKFILSLLVISLPLFSFAQEDKEIGMDQKIDQAFGNATGWFVEFIFYQERFMNGKIIE